MTKPSKIKNNLSPVCIPVLTLSVSAELECTIKNIEHKYGFQNGALHEGLTKLVNWLEMDKELKRQELRPSDEKEAFSKLRELTQELLMFFDKSSCQFRNKIIDVINENEFLKNKSVDAKKRVTPYVFEETLEILEYACVIALKQTPRDRGGLAPNSSLPRKIIFELINIFTKGSNSTPLCYKDAHTNNGFNGNFYHFLLEINPVVTEINPKLNLGTDITIGDYANECLQKCKEFVTPA